MTKRPPSDNLDEKNRLKKRVRHDQTKFTSVADIQAFLRSQDVGILIQGLNTLRNQWTIRFNEGIPGPQDERLLLAKAWLETYPAERDVFGILDNENKSTANITAPCLAVLSAVLDLLSSQYIYHSLGLPILKNLLSPARMRKLNTYVGDKNSEVILWTVKLLNSISNFAGGVEKRALMDGFEWRQKTVQSLLFQRRKTKVRHDQLQKFRPDIRTLFIDFILSFLSPSTPTPIKLSLLEQHRDVFLLIFKGIHQDAYTVVRRILETCWEAIWNDHKIKRTLKVGLFNESTLNQLLKLYQRTESENAEDLIPADLVHQFMLTMMTRPGLGICFKDRGWYPRENTSDISLDGPGVNISEESGRAKIYNKILANIIKVLKLNEDPRQWELASRILQACPELVAGFWGVVNLTLEPRLASRWITNISILGTIISLPIPLECFFIPNSSHLNPSPPTLGTVLANILPPVLSKSYLTKGIQSSSGLIRHCTALALSKCLAKFERVLYSFRENAAKLQEREENGQWLKLLRELQSEIEKRVPEFTVVVGMVQQKLTGPSSKEQAMKVALLTESGLRLSWLYHKLLPRLISNVKFDAGKLLLNVSNPSDITAEEDDTDKGASSMQVGNNSLDTLRQLHVLRLLKENNQFELLNKFGSSSHTSLHMILMLYATAISKSVHQATAELLAHLLASSIAFSHDPCEVGLWLQSIPAIKRRPNAAASDGTPLGNEIVSVLTFLDDCIQRCSKMFYRYLEESVEFFHENQVEDNQLQSLGHDRQSFPSPLIMTVFEQLKAKLAGGLLTPSDTLAIVTFLRKLGISLVSKVSELHHLRKIHARLRDILIHADIAPRSDVMQQSIRREEELMEHTLNFINNPVPIVSNSTDATVEEFLGRMETLPTPASDEEIAYRAYELVDWARMVHVSLHSLEAKRLFNIILRHSSPAGRDFLYQLDPSSGQFWVCLEGHEDIISDLLPFELVHLHTAPHNMLREVVRETLALSFVSGSSWNKSVKRKASVAIHRLTSDNSSIQQSELCLFIDIFERGLFEDSESQLKTLKRALFSNSRVVKAACSSEGPPSNIIIDGLAKLVELAMKPSEPEDHEILLPYSSYWAAAFQANSDFSVCVGGLPWLPFVDSGILVKLLDTLIAAAKDPSYIPSSLEQKFIGAILKIFTARSPSDTLLLRELYSRVPGLLSLKKLLEEATLVDSLLLLLLEARLPVGYHGMPLTNFISPTLTVSYAMSIAQVRWQSITRKILEDDSLLTDLISSGHWTSPTAKIATTLIYQSPNARRVFWTWFTSSDIPQNDDHEYLLPLYAYLDVAQMLQENDDTLVQLPANWVATLANCLISPRSPDSISSLCSRCIKLACQISSPNRETFIMHMTEEVERNYPVRLPVIQLVYELREIGISKSTVLIDAVLNWILKWMVDIFTGEELLTPVLAILEQLSRFFDGVESKPHSVELAMKAAIQNCLHMPAVLRCILPLLKSTHLKPVIVNRLLQSVVQHNQLYRVTALPSPARGPVIRLLHSLFHLHPANTCQANHLSPLLPLYSGTLSAADQLLFSIFQLYERQRRETVASFLHTWTSSTATLSQSTLETLINLDSNKIFQSCTRFPTRRSFVDCSNKPTINDENTYDPLFLALLAAQLLMEYKNLSTGEWVQVFRTNIISFLVCLLASRSAEIRTLGVVSLGGLLHRLQYAEFQEKGQVIYVLDLLRDILPLPALEMKHFRLPTSSALLFAHALRSIFYPSSFLYPIISRFLLQRPEFDFKDVPMLYHMLYSSEDGEWQKERAWMLKFLTDVMNDGSTQDCSILKRRHTWDLLASIWQASKPEDRSLRKSILEFLANLSASQHVSFLFLRSSLLPWIEMQLLSKAANDNEYLVWAKILENVAVTIEKGKIEKALQGEYIAIVSRCLHLILDSISVYDACHLSAKISALFLVIRSLLRMVCLDITKQCNAGVILQDCAQTLLKLEKFILYRNESDSLFDQNAIAFPEAPHRAKTLFDELGSRVEPDENIFTLTVWRKTVLMLWRVIMASNTPGTRVNVHTWDMITCRVLALGTIFGRRIDDEESRIADWVRQQAMIGLVK